MSATGEISTRAEHVDEPPKQEQLQDAGGDSSSKQTDDDPRRSVRIPTLTTKGQEYYVNMEKDKRNLFHKRLTRQMTLIEGLYSCIENVDNVNAQLVILDSIFADLVSSNLKYQGFLTSEEEQRKVSTWIDGVDDNVFTFKQLCFSWLSSAQEELRRDALSSASSSTKSSHHSVSQRSQSTRHSVKLKQSVASKVHSTRSKHTIYSKKSRTSVKDKEDVYVAELKAEIEGLKVKHEIELKAESLRQEAAIAGINEKIAIVEAARSVKEAKRTAKIEGTKGARKKELKAEKVLEMKSAAKQESKDEVLGIHEGISAISQSMCQMLKLQSVPEVGIDVFTGEYMEYHYFMATFGELVESKIDDQLGKLTRLIKYTSGEPKDLIKHCIQGNPKNCYDTAKSLLEKHFGNPNRIACAYMKELNDWPALKTGDSIAFSKFYRFLLKCQTCKDNSKYLKELDSQQVLRVLQSKLPFALQDRWNRLAVESRRKKGSEVTFSHLVDLVEVESQLVSDPMYSREALSEFRDKKSDNRPRVNVNATRVDEGGGETLSCPRCWENHDLEECKDFLKLNVQDRNKFVWEKRLCFACLEKFSATHKAKTCDKRRKCKTCEGSHPTSLHGYVHVRATSLEIHSQLKCNSSLINNDITSMCIVPVRIRHKNSENEVIVYAMLDECSQGTFIDEDVLQTLNILEQGRPATITVKTISGESTEDCIALQGLSVMPVGRYRHQYGSKEVSLPVTYSSTSLPVDKEEIPTPKKLNGWPHLAAVASTLEEYSETIPIGLLIGANCPKALEPHEFIHSADGGPYAYRSCLGWCVVGPVSKQVSQAKTDLKCNVIAVKDASTNELASHRFVIENEVEENTVARLLSEMYNTEFTEASSEKKTMSAEDQRFMNIMEESVRVINGHYELPLPFRNVDVVMPNNWTQASQRLKSIERKFKRNPEFYIHYVTFMNALFEKGYAQKVDPEKRTEVGKIWYLPHHGTYHPKKPGKIRVVFDASAVYEGHSLNGELLQGPDLTNRLVGVLLRFRRESIPFMGDIESMFCQVKVPYHQRSFLRFLWWEDGDYNSKPIECEMCVHIFGAVSSSSCAGYALKKTADDHESNYGSVVGNTLRKSFYVDDLLGSEKDEDSASALLLDVKRMCEDGGFHLTKISSSSMEVMKMVPATDRSEDLRDLSQLSSNPLHIERALGVHWCVSNDLIGFNILLQEKPLTRRGILSTISSIYDPLGLAGPFLLKGRRILQEITAYKCSWDAPISQDHRMQWEKWRKELPMLEKIQVPRCYKPNDFSIVVDASLHTFSDASEEGYGVCVYLRLVNEQGNIHVSLVMGKSRVCPLKRITIPRLELTAATVSVKLAAVVIEELELENLRQFYWTDSRIVLGYIANETKRLRIFEGNRTNLIRKYTHVKQWGYVNTLFNPADYASRGLSMTCTFKVGLWFNGPDFLWKSIDAVELLREVNYPLSEDDPGVKACKVNAIEVEERIANVLEEKPLDLLTTLEERYSDWMWLKRIVTYMLKFISYSQMKFKGVEGKERCFVDSLQDVTLRVEDIQHTERIIISLVQKKYFEEEINLIKNLPSDRKVRKVKLKKSSNLSKLNPFIDDEGLLRVDGRLSKSVLDEFTKCPVILPKNCKISELIIRWHHKEVQHSGRSITLNELRSAGFWVVNGNSMVRRLIHKCVICRFLRGHLSEQKMAPLPIERTCIEPPFTYCGVDMFGPLYVKEGRKELKCYGALFTCFASRAVHIEMTRSLETDSFLQALRRLLARRGVVRSIRSDNGTNFVGAENEYRQAVKEVKEMDNDKIRDFLLSKGTDWIVWEKNPPTASHMGGVWERQIRSVRSILVNLLKENSYRVNVESLNTLLTEAEAIVNSRPLTVECLSDPSGPLPLSPSNLLTMKSKVVMSPPGDFERADLYCRKRWRAVQYLANEFWTRWKTEYLQLLQPRSKWTTERRNFRIGDVVLLKDESLKRSYWPLGRVTKVFPDGDGLVRHVEMYVPNSGTENHVLQRPINKLVLLVEADSIGE